MEKLVFQFSQNEADGHAKMKDLLGGKGAGLAEMCRIGVPVPPGFTISTQAYHVYQAEQGVGEVIQVPVRQSITWLSENLGKSFEGHGSPLLLSVRSGARVSMPGMMDTILNLGLNRTNVDRLAQETGNRRFALDSYRRFIQMYGDVVLGIDIDEFERLLERTRHGQGVVNDADLSESSLDRLVDQYLDLVIESTGNPFPEDPYEQLWGAIRAVFESWQNPRAQFYRKIHGYPDEWGTAVTVQSMVFGNLGDDSGTGVCFSRNPSDGVNQPYGEYLINAQGEDVVAGIRTPHPIAGDDAKSMERCMPETYSELCATMTRLETHFQDMQDIEFTIERGKLFILQTRNGKRTSHAALKIAVDMALEGLISKEVALKRVDPQSIAQLLASEFDPESKNRVVESGNYLGKGLNAGPGAATGMVVFNPEQAVLHAEQGRKVILVREETSPEDIAGMHAATGILTQRGGMTSHAAVVARGMGKPCVVGCSELRVEASTGTMHINNRLIRLGESISIDGSTGEIFLGEIQTQPSPLVSKMLQGRIAEGEVGFPFQLLMDWADEVRTIGIRTNADTPVDAKLARALGAEGIGLCRTEHMFFGEDRIQLVREMILVDGPARRKRVLDQLQPLQMNDFYEMFKEMNGLPVTIRLLDPPLHEFLPHTPAQIKTVAEGMGVDENALILRVHELSEANPMLGHRGCRLAVSFPEIYTMQVQAIIDAVVKARGEGFTVRAEIMIPLITTSAELAYLVEGYRPMLQRAGLEDIPIGTMIETPRAALTTDEICQVAQFFSFGTNDLTQCGFGLSRDDSGSFLPLYLEKNLYEADPFKTIDRKGIGKLVKMGIQAARALKPDFKVGVCGEHGGDPESVGFFVDAGVDYVSCSPYRVPVARLAAAQSQLVE
ncbi:MAG: pyruvate, phosphate dikinase [Acidobacteria bacterium]|nr:pyruvate, phosphate dikinase [Acidobacteriota bacterium]MCB9396758.1 pyruvate, phosphate dikinase [Acidobacteriota bacterium]